MAVEPEYHVITINGTQNDDHLYIVPDQEEKRTKGDKFRKGKELVKKFRLKTRDKRRKQVMNEQRANINGSNPNTIAKGKTYTCKSFCGKIVNGIRGCKLSGINEHGVLILDPKDCNFFIHLDNIQGGETLKGMHYRVCIG